MAILMAAKFNEISFNFYKIPKLRRVTYLTKLKCKCIRFFKFSLKFPNVWKLTKLIKLTKLKSTKLSILKMCLLDDL